MRLAFVVVLVAAVMWLAIWALVDSKRAQWKKWDAEELRHAQTLAASNGLKVLILRHEIRGKERAIDEIRAQWEEMRRRLHRYEWGDGCEKARSSE